MALNRQKQIEQFAKLAATVLGRCPHEFGLVPDADGFVKIKEFIQAIIETDGWRHVRISHINDMMLMMPDPPVEVDETRIRAKDRSHLPELKHCENPPRLLYIGIKQKSYSAILTDGIHPTFHSRVVCFSDPAMAVRVGKRRDPDPILLTIHVDSMKKEGVAIFESGEDIYLTDIIPVGCFTGPPLPKEMTAPKRTEKKPDPVKLYKQQTQAGTFPADPFSINAPDGKTQKGKHGEKDASWKRNKKRLRKEKNQYWSDS
jgi:putative RNA 2'-phosphotransferase